jgi:hypothetical protein
MEPNVEREGSEAIGTDVPPNITPPSIGERDHQSATVNIDTTNPQLTEEIRRIEIDIGRLINFVSENTRQFSRPIISGTYRSFVGGILMIITTIITLMDFMFYYTFPILAGYAKQQNTFDYSSYLYVLMMIIYVLNFIIIIITCKTSLLYIIVVIIIRIIDYYVITTWVDIKVNKSYSTDYISNVLIYKCISFCIYMVFKMREYYFIDAMGDQR